MKTKSTNKQNSKSVDRAEAIAKAINREAIKRTTESKSYEFSISGIDATTKKPLVLQDAVARLLSLALQKIKTFKDGYDVGRLAFALSILAYEFDDDISGFEAAMEMDEFLRGFELGKVPTPIDEALGITFTVHK